MGVSGAAVRADNLRASNIFHFTLFSGSNSSSIMLSRLASTAVRDFSFGRSLLHTTSAVSTKPAGKPDDYFDPWENPERDYVNFPTQRPALYSSPTRHVIFPEHWFKAFYPKTGVTGPYALAAGLATFALSKEYYIIEHETFAGLQWAVCMAIVVKYVIRPYALPLWDSQVDNDINRLKKFVKMKLTNTSRPLMPRERP